MKLEVLLTELLQSLGLTPISALDKEYFKRLLQLLMQEALQEISSTALSEYGDNTYSGSRTRLALIWLLRKLHGVVQLVSLGRIRFDQ